MVLCHGVRSAVNLKVTFGIIVLGEQLEVFGQLWIDGGLVALAIWTLPLVPLAILVGQARIEHNSVCTWASILKAHISKLVRYSGTEYLLDCSWRNVSIAT